MTSPRPSCCDATIRRSRGRPPTRPPCIPGTTACSVAARSTRCARQPRPWRPWPETATSVAVRLDAAGTLHVCAPLGLDDLLDGVWRRNPRRVTVELSRARLARHDPARRWPGVRILPP
ncbi:nucleotidyltransferase family protein [Micromonospora sp. I033]